jgi:hypothetical protein
MELTAGNLSRRSRALGAASKSAKVRNLRRCDWAQLRNFRSQMSSSVEIVKTWLGFPYICEFFQICPRPLHTYMPHKKFPRNPLNRF